MPVKRPEVIGRGPEFPKINFKLPSGPTRIGIIFALVIFGTFMIINLFFVYIHPWEMGIKQVNVGIFTSKGLKETAIGPGFVFRIPTFESIHRFPNHVQVLDLTDNTFDRRTKSYSRDNAAMIQTSDGFYVNVDVSILYKIIDPYKVITTLGAGEAYLYQGIVPKAEPILKQALGELTTEEFYNSPLRVAKAELARDLLDAEMREKGMEVHYVLIREFEYSSEIQKNIEEKKLQDQLVFKNQSQGRAATEEAKIKKVTQEGEMSVKVTLERGSAYKVTKDAERDLYVRTKRAEADLLVQLAEAKRTEMKNEAMQAKGVDRAVALRMAEVLRGLDVIVVPVGGPQGFNPLDLEQMIDLFGVVND